MVLKVSNSLKLFLVFGFLFAFVFAGNTGKIVGRVVDAETGEPLVGVNVLVEGTTLGAATDANGEYFIINVPPGTYRVKAMMIGYGTVIKDGVRVIIDHTTQVDFDLSREVIKGEVVVVEAKKEIIKKDQAGSAVATGIEDISGTPLVRSIEEYASLQAGVRGWSVRGGDVSETKVFVDGLTLVDNFTSQPVAVPNLSTLKEFVILKGGFNAEYGNVRSGIVNVVTKDPSFDGYHGDITFEIQPPHREHYGCSALSHKCYYLRPFLDTGDSLCWYGTNILPEEERKSYPEFEGWIAFSEKLLSDDDPNNDMTPEEARDLFLWLYRAGGADDLLDKYPNNYSGPSREARYSHKPNLLIDASIDGPLRILKNTAFLLSFRSDHQMWALPSYPLGRDAFESFQVQGKIKHKFSPKLDFTLEGLYNKISSISNEGRWGVQGHVAPSNPLIGGRAIFNRSINPGYNYIYMPYANVPFDRKVRMIGIGIDRILSSRMFYKLRLSYLRINDYSPGRYLYHYGDTKNPLDVNDFLPDSIVHDISRDVGVHIRDTSAVIWFGSVGVDEAPYGIPPKDQYYPLASLIYNQPYGLYGTHATAPFNFSKRYNLNLKFDLTYQINMHHQVKTGITVNYDRFNSFYGFLAYPGHESNELIYWTADPFSVGAYIQDKIEFKGMNANVGIRFDYFNPNAYSYTLEPYSKYFMEVNKYRLTEEAPKKKAKQQLFINPRLGVSHPIGENLKLYFNYGIFSQIPRTDMLYTINYGMARGIQFMGNPELKMPKTIAYEIGVEQSLFNMFLVHVSGYYKDVTNEYTNVSYENYDGTVNYVTVSNNTYRDIRGFELKVEKRWGKWITGWVNYDYRVETRGRIGRRAYYEDIRRQQIEGMQDPFQEKPLPRPRMNAFVQLSVPLDWGPAVFGSHIFGGFSISLVHTREAGNYFTWDPLQTYDYYMNVQEKDWVNWNARISKNVALNKFKMVFYVDVRNLFNTKHMSWLGFSDQGDFEAYMKSLHLPMYNDKRYKEAGYVGGNDRFGEYGKDYIDMPNIKFLTFLYPRTFTVGMKVNF